MCGDGVPVKNYVEDDGSLLAEKEKEEEAKRSQKKAKPTVEPKANPGAGATTMPAAGVGPPGKRRKKAVKEKTEAWAGNNFLRNEPSPGAAIRDVIGTISSGVIRRGSGKVITKLLSDRWPRGGGERRSGGEGMLRRGDGNGGAPGHGDAPANEVTERQHC